MRYRGSYFPDSATQYIDDFGGLDLRNRIANNAFSEMLNMSPEGAPEIVTRAYRYLSRAQFGANEYVGAIATVTVCRDDLTGTTPSNKEFTEEPAYVYTAPDGSCSLVFGMDGDETQRGFFSVPITAAGPFHSLAVIGRKIVVAPEMIIVNLDTGAVTSVEATVSGVTTFAFTDEDLTDFGQVINTNTKIYDSSDNHPDGSSDPTGTYFAMVWNGEDKWRRIAVGPGAAEQYKGYEIRKYSHTSKSWRTQNKYLKLFMSASDAAKFRQKDAVSISGTGTSLDGEYILWDVGSDYIVINAEFSGSPFDYCPAIDYSTGTWKSTGGDWDGKSTFEYNSQGQISATITRRMPPKVQHICESGNRIWWCGFGKTADELINWIGCSKTGDPYNFYDAGDSWIGIVGEAGDFTGVAEVEGKPVFFKEGCVFEVGGSLPSSFRVTRRDTRGMEKSSSGAVCVSGGAAYYSSSDGPRVYGGSYSQRLTGAFGSTDIDASALAADGRFIYIAAKNVTAQTDGSPEYAGQDAIGIPTTPAATQEEAQETTPNGWFIGLIGDVITSTAAYIMAVVREQLGGGNSALFVYDTEKGAIYRLEDHLFTCLASVKSGGVVGYDASARRIVSTVPLAETDKETSPVEWQLTTGDVYANTPDMKYISAARVRMRVAAGGYAELWLSCDRGQWERQAFCAKEGVFTYRVPIIPGRCDSFRLRLNGEGQARLVSIAYEITEGGQ